MANSYDGYRPYGATASDWVTATATADSVTVFTPSAGATLTVHDAEFGGNQITDLLDDSGAGINSVMTDDNGAVPRFHAPESLTELWVDGGANRVQLLPTNDYTRDEVEALLAGKSGTDVAAIQALLAQVVLDNDQTPPTPGIWLVRPA